MSETTQSGQPGRYNRSFGGLIGSMIVLVLVVLGIVVFRGTFRDTPEYEPEKIDYLALVASVQQSGLTPAYPAQLPDGWFVKDARFVPGDRPVLDLAISTDDGSFAGIHQEDASIDELVDTYVGDEATEGDEVADRGDRRADLADVLRPRRRPRVRRRARRPDDPGLRLGRRGRAAAAWWSRSRPTR